MDTENVQNTENPEISSTPAPSIETPAPIIEGGENPAPAAYTPNYKFKVLDKELEIDDYMKGIVKDADSEKKVKELYEKAYGLDHVKSKFETLKQKESSHYQKIEGDYNSLNKTIGMLDGMLQAGDIDNFIKALEIPETTLLKWAVKKAELMGLPQEAQQDYNNQVALRNKAYQLEQQNLAYQNQFQSSQVQEKAFQLDSEISKPEVSQVASSYDVKVGKPGAFRDEVIKRGNLHWHLYQQDISVDQAVKEVMGLVGGYAQSIQQTTNTQGNPADKVIPAKPNVIPNLSGQGTSPVKKKIGNLDDLKKYAQEQIRN